MPTAGTGWPEDLFRTFGIVYTFSERKPHKPTAYVFGDKIGGQVKDPKKIWLKCCAAAGVSGLHFHDLRHEAGSRLMERGWLLHHVSALLGHADIKTTDTT